MGFTMRGNQDMRPTDIDITNFFNDPSWTEFEIDRFINAGMEKKAQIWGRPCKR